MRLTTFIAKRTGWETLSFWALWNALSDNGHFKDEFTPIDAFDLFTKLDCLWELDLNNANYVFYEDQIF